MSVDEHRLSFAAFLVEKPTALEERVLLDCTIGDNLPCKASVRKLCLCGSQLVHDVQSQHWFCSTSGVEIQLKEFNTQPLELDDDDCSSAIPESLKDEKSVGAIALDRANKVQVLVKVPREQLWLIADPLPVFDFMIVKPMPTAPVVEWFFDVGHSSSSISFTVRLDVRGQLQQEALRQLPRQTTVTLRFIEADNLSLIARKRISLASGCEKVLREATVYAQLIGEDRYDFAGAMSDLALGEELSSAVLKDALVDGPCRQFLEEIGRAEGYDITEVARHVSTCEKCRLIYGNLFEKFLGLFGKQ